MGEAKDCLKQVDAVLAQPALSDEAFSAYVDLNERFHTLLYEMADSPVTVKQLERVVSLPFASASAFVVVQSNSPQARDMLVVAQDQHWQVLDAIERGEGTRAEALMREHSRLAQRNLRQVLSGQGPAMPASMKAMKLIRRRG